MTIDNANIPQRSNPSVSLKAYQNGHRDWTAVEKYKLKGMAARRLPAHKIARALRRSVGTTRSMASKLGIHLAEDAASPTNEHTFLSLCCITGRDRG
jgi:hypothetical protein